MAPVPTTRLETRDLLRDGSLAIDEFVVQAVREDPEFRAALSLVPGASQHEPLLIVVHRDRCLVIDFTGGERR